MENNHKATDSPSGSSTSDGATKPNPSSAVNNPNITMYNLAGETYSFKSSEVTNLDHPNGLSAFALLYQYEQTIGVPKNHLRIISMQDNADYNETFCPEDPNSMVDINYKVLLPFNPSINQIHVVVANSHAYAKDLDLNNADLRSARLHKAKLGGVNLKKANLFNAVLEKADLQAANLMNSNLQEATLTGANLKFANLEGANLFNAVLEKADLRAANLMNSNLEEATLKKAILKSANLEGANLRFADLRGAYLNNAKLMSSNLERAHLTKANLTFANLRSANLTRANLGCADLHSAKLKSSNLKEATLTGANLRFADLQGADLSGVDLNGADLYGADLSGVDLNGADLYGALLPGEDKLINLLSTDDKLLYVDIGPDQKALIAELKENYGGYTAAHKDRLKQYIRTLLTGQDPKMRTGMLEVLKYAAIVEPSTATARVFGGLFGSGEGAGGACPSAPRVAVSEAASPSWMLVD